MTYKKKKLKKKKRNPQTGDIFTAKQLQQYYQNLPTKA